MSQANTWRRYFRIRRRGSDSISLASYYRRYWNCIYSTIYKTLYVYTCVLYVSSTTIIIKVRGPIRFRSSELFQTRFIPEKTCAYMYNNIRNVSIIKFRSETTIQLCPPVRRWLSTYVQRPRRLYEIIGC